MPSRTEEHASLAEMRAFLAQEPSADKPAFSRYARTAQALRRKLEALQLAFPELGGVSLSPQLEEVVQLAKPAEAA